MLSLCYSISIDYIVYCNVSSRAEALPPFSWSFSLLYIPLVSLSGYNIFFFFLLFHLSCKSVPGFLSSACSIFWSFSPPLFCLPIHSCFPPRFQLLSLLSAFVLSLVLIYRGIPTHSTCGAIPFRLHSLSYLPSFVACPTLTWRSLLCLFSRRAPQLMTLRKQVVAGSFLRSIVLLLVSHPKTKVLRIASYCV